MAYQSRNVSPVSRSPTMTWDAGSRQELPLKPMPSHHPTALLLPPWIHSQLQQLTNPSSPLARCFTVSRLSSGGCASYTEVGMDADGRTDNVPHPAASTFVDRFTVSMEYCGSNLSFDVLIDGVALATTSLLRRDQQELRTLRDEWQRVHPSTPLPDDIAALTLEDEGSGRSVIDVILSEEMEEIASPCLPDIATDVAAAWGYQWLALPQIPSLVSWTTDSVNGLRLIAEDIRMCVRRRQVELLELLKGGNQGVSDEWGGEEVLPGKDRICMEFSMLNDMDSEATFDWLVTSLKIGSQTMPSTVRVKLPLSLCDAASTLPAIFMTVEWPLDDRSSPAVSLSSPASDVVANHLGDRWHIRILASVLKTGWQIDTLAAVVKGDVEAAINEITNNILKSRTQKSNLAKALVAEIGTMLEWSMLDNGSLSVSIAMVEKKIPFIIIIVITNRYPQEQPEIRISSMKPVLRRAPLVIHTTYPYSPRWDAAELARRVKAWLGEKALGEFI